MAAPTILIVDDETELLNVVAQLLAGEGYNVLTAPDGLEAVKILGAQNPKDPASRIKVVLSDMVMPHMNGEELLGHVRKGGFKGVTVVIMSGNLDQAGAQALMVKDVDGILFKPFAPDALITQIKLAMQRREHKEMTKLLG